MTQKQKKPSWEIPRHFVYIETFARPDPSLAAGLNSEILWYYHGKLERQQLPLGQNLQGLIYSLWHGFHPDALSALCGCVLGGSAVVLLGPPLAKLHLFNDPIYANISLYPGICPLNTVYLKRVQTALFQLEQEGSLHRYQALTAATLAKTLEQIFTNSLSVESFAPLQATPEQHLILERIGKGLKSSPRHWSLFANRGFGKTTCLRLAVEYIQAHFKKSCTLIWLEPSAKKRSQWRDKDVTAVSLEKLLQRLEQVSHSTPPLFVIVDECAKIPRQTLEKLLCKAQDHWVLLASSVDGYEGSGTHLIQLSSRHSLIQLSLTKPLRWAEQDPLDHWVKNTLLAKTMQMPPPTSYTQPSQESRFNTLDCRYQTHSADICQPLPCLAGTQEPWLRLMSLAHYRTRPGDLRIMLDAPGQQCFAIHQDNQLLAGLWVSLEGPIPAPLHQEILQKKRRLKGNLAPQYAAQHGVEGALLQQWVRIVRVAVRPDMQYQGLGTCLINSCRTHYSHQHLAVSFKPDRQLAAFWTKQGFYSITPSFWIMPGSSDAP